MATVVVKNFDLYNTTNYWLGYSIPDYETEQALTQIYYGVQFSSNTVGSQIDYFSSLAGITVDNPIFGDTDVTLDELPFLWLKYWWEEAMYYCHPTARAALLEAAPDYYQNFSESVGGLYYVSKFNNLLNTETVPYNSIIEPLLVPGIRSSVPEFYAVANALFTQCISSIGPGEGTDTSPANGALIMADSDLERRLASIETLRETINEAYPKINALLPINTSEIGNLFTPYYWSLSANNEDSTIDVDFTNTNLNTLYKLPLTTLQVETNGQV